MTYTSEEKRLKHNITSKLSREKHKIKYTNYLRHKQIKKYIQNALQNNTIIITSLSSYTKYHKILERLHFTVLKKEKSQRLKISSIQDLIIENTNDQNVKILTSPVSKLKYKVYSDSTILSLRTKKDNSTVTKTIKPIMANHGYKTVEIFGKKFLLHNLILYIFQPIPQEYLNQGYTFNTLFKVFKDRNPNNTQINNLMYTTKDYFKTTKKIC